MMEVEPRKAAKVIPPTSEKRGVVLQGLSSKELQGWADLLCGDPITG